MLGAPPKPNLAPIFANDPRDQLIIGDIENKYTSNGDYGKSIQEIENKWKIIVDFYSKKNREIQYSQQRYVGNYEFGMPRYTNPPQAPQLKSEWNFNRCKHCGTTHNEKPNCRNCGAPLEEYNIYES